MEKATRILFEIMVQGTFAEENQLVEPLILYCTHPPFGEVVEIGRPKREFERFNADGQEDIIEVLGKLGITDVEKVAGLVMGVSSTVKLRAICVSHASLGKGVMPAS